MIGFIFFGTFFVVFFIIFLLSIFNNNRKAKKGFFKIALFWVIMFFVCVYMPAKMFLNYDNIVSERNEVVAIIKNSNSQNLNGLEMAEVSRKIQKVNEEIKGLNKCAKSLWLGMFVDDRGKTLPQIAYPEYLEDFVR